MISTVAYFSVSSATQRSYRFYYFLGEKSHRLSFFYLV